MENMTSIKSNNQSDLHRLEGNKQYADRHFYEALKLYNKSLCFAEENSEILSKNYGNRSAVYFECQLYEKCLNNISLATTGNNTVENQMKKLSQRKQMCLEKLKNKQEVDHQSDSSSDFLKLSYEANKKNSWIVNCLEVKSSDKFGRFVTASKELKVGSVIAFEEPYLKVIKPSNHYNRCSFCLEDNLLDLIPCSGCASGIVLNNPFSYFVLINCLSFQSCSVLQNARKKLSNNIIIMNVILWSSCYNLKTDTFQCVLSSKHSSVLMELSKTWRTF